MKKKYSFRKTLILAFEEFMQPLIAAFFIVLFFSISEHWNVIHISRNFSNMIYKNVKHFQIERIQHKKTLQ